MKILFFTFLSIFIALSGNANQNSNISQFVAEFETSRNELQGLLLGHDGYSYFEGEDCDHHILYNAECTNEQTRLSSVKNRMSIRNGIYFRTIDFKVVYAPKVIRFHDRDSFQTLLAKMKAVSDLSSSSENLIQDLEEYVSGKKFDDDISYEKMSKINILLNKIKKLIPNAEHLVAGNSLSDTDAEKISAGLEWLKSLKLIIQTTSFKNKDASMVAARAYRYFWTNKNDITLHIPAKVGNASYTKIVDTGIYGLLNEFEKTEEIKF